MDLELEQCLYEFTADSQQKMARGKFSFPVDFPVFDGHFPGQPVFPAFVQLALIRLLAEKLSGCRLRPVSSGKLKFVNMVLPDQEIVVTITFKTTEPEWKTDFRIVRGPDTIAKGQMLYRGLNVDAQK